MAKNDANDTIETKVISFLSSFVAPMLNGVILLVLAFMLQKTSDESNAREADSRRIAQTLTLVQGLVTTDERHDQALDKLDDRIRHLETAPQR